MGVPTTNEGVVIAIESLHHIGICVTDLARAKAFYSGVLGLREIPRPPFDFGGAWYQVGDRAAASDRASADTDAARHS